MNDKANARAINGTRPRHLLKPRTWPWPIGRILGIDTRRSAELGQDYTLGDAINHLQQTRVWRVVTGLFWRSGLAMLLLLALAVLAAIFVGDRVYRNLQLHYQTQMLHAVAEADVIHDICRRRSDIFWSDCATPADRGEMSDRMVWAMLVSADVIDPLSIAVPNQLQNLAGSDASAAVVANWLRNRDRARLTGVPLLIAVAEFCTSSMGGVNYPALSATVNAALADIYQPLPGGEDWLRPEMLRALGLSSPAWLAAPDAAEPGGTWPVPSDLRGTLGVEGSTLLEGSQAERSAAAWRALVGTTTEDAAGTVEPIAAFLGDSTGRRALPDQIGDADVVASLFAIGALIDRDTSTFMSTFEECELKETLKREAEALDPDQKQAMVANLEKLAIYVAGQIRISPEVERARFWVSVYTGHEQRLILIVAAFGVIVVLSRIVVFLVSTLIAAVSQRPAALNPIDKRPVDAPQRDNEFDRLASSRWPIRIAVAILPAIGFIGTVRGIMLSLSGADAIVWAETVNQRSAAISGLSADLGLAFATTLLALMFGALLTILVAIEMALGERLLIRRYAHTDTKGRDYG